MDKQMLLTGRLARIFFFASLFCPGSPFVISPTRFSIESLSLKSAPPLGASHPRPPLAVSKLAACAEPDDSGFATSRRDALRAAGGLFIAATGAHNPSAAAAEASFEVRKESPGDFLEVPYNELDAGAAKVLAQEEMIWESIQQRREDAVFSFRGGKLLKTNSQGALRYLARRGAVFLGETHNHPEDKALALSILKSLYKSRSGDIAFGLEMVQKPFQKVLDWYVFEAPPSKSADRALLEGTEWRTRWFWDFEAYLPLFRFCQLNKVRMVALNVQAETTAKVRSRGLTALTAEERSDLIMDPAGFRADSLAATFPDYVQAVLRPSFNAHVRMGIFAGDDETFRNFVSNRILWDEAMASSATAFMVQNPGTQLVGLVGGDHVKTGHGIPSRLERILSDLGVPTRVASVSLNPSWQIYSQSRSILTLQKEENLNPTARSVVSADALDSQSQPFSATPPSSSQPLASARQGSAGGEAWQTPPPAVQNPFSDIIWFS